ncbi:MAG: L-threonylcarbamoyladenylate synthase [Methanomassiliicoccales archaeon]
MDVRKYCTFNGNKVVSCRLPEQLMEEIGSVLKDGGMVVYPTDTIYCIGTDIFDEHSVKRVFMMKQRPFDMPISVCVGSRQMANRIANLNRAARKLIEELMPGPLIILAEKKGDVPDLLTAGTATVGIRIPDHPLARGLLENYGPMTSASANKHSKPDPSTVDQAMKDLGDAIDIYIDCGKTLYGQQSTIVDTTDESYPIVRKGPIPEEKIREVLSQL